MTTIFCYTIICSTLPMDSLPAALPDPIREIRGQFAAVRRSRRKRGEEERRRRKRTRL